MTWKNKKKLRGKKSKRQRKRQWMLRNRKTFKYRNPMIIDDRAY